MSSCAPTYSRVPVFRLIHDAELLRRQIVVAVLVAVYDHAQVGRMFPQQLHQFIYGHCFPPAWAAAILTLPP